VTRILIAVDGSSHSAKVARATIRQAAAYRQPPELHLVYVHLPLPTLGGLMKPVGHEALQRYYAENQYALAGPEALLAAFEASCGCELDTLYAEWGVVAP